MNVSPFRLTVCFAFCCCIFGSALAGQTTSPDRGTRRIFVEPFVTQAGSEKLREDMIAELRKMKSVSLAGNESSADVILGAAAKSGSKDTVATTHSWATWHPTAHPSIPAFFQSS